MQPNQVWKSKETKSYLLKIVGMNPNGTVKITFDFGYIPKTTHNYTVDYLNQYYEYAGYESVWVNEAILTSPLPSVVAPINTPKQTTALDDQFSEIDKAFAELDAEKVLFGNYTGDKKVNTWREVK